MKRYVRDLRDQQPDAFVWVEVDPGQEAQVDFGFAGMLMDSSRGVMRRAWVFVMTLAHSRHHFARIVFDQCLATWLGLPANPQLLGRVDIPQRIGRKPRNIVEGRFGLLPLFQSLVHEPQGEHAAHI